jgi:uncharacterized repeat protein (TIGR01451 family)
VNRVLRGVAARVRPYVSLCVLALCLIFALSPGFAAPALARSSSARLRVVVSGLPPSAQANVSLRGPRGFVRRLRGSARLTAAPPGAYEVLVAPVRFAHPYRGVPAGSEAFPSQQRLRIRAVAGSTSVIHVIYGTIRSARVLVLHATPLAITGPASDPRAILLSFRAGAGIGRGAILAQAPTSKLPNGLFDRVVGVRRTRRGKLLSLKPALLSEAFPQLEVHTTVPLEFGSPPAAKPARAASFLNDVDLSFSDDLIPGRLESSCGAPPTGWSLSPFGTLRPTLNVDIHRGFLGLAYGELSVSLAGNIGFEATIPSAVHCGLTIDGPRGEAVVPVAGVPVPVEGSINLGLTLALDGATHVRVQAGATVTAGTDLHGAYGTPILHTSNRSASGSVTGSGVKLTLGPEVQVGLGLSDVNAHVDGSLFVAGKGSAGGCEVDLGASAGVGLDLWSLHASYTPFEPEVPLYHCPAQASPPKLQITQTSPPGAFPGQEFDYTVHVTNTGGSTADGVEVLDTLPGEGSFASSSPAGSPSSPAPASTITIPLGDLAAGQTGTATVRWHAPNAQVGLTNSALAKAANAGQVGPALASVPVGVTGACNPCGAASAGTGLRNRDRGVITINGIPSGATITQAVLVWGILYGGEQPSNDITFAGHQIAANLTSNVSGNLCWGDTATVGYAADVTPYVTGNGVFEVTNPPNGEIRVDESPYGVLPYTDGASLIVFYDGGGADNQVLSNFSYNTNTDPATDESITRTFEGIDSVGGPASLTLAGPDGQNNGGKIFTFSGAGELSVENPFEGGAPQEGPSFPIGNLWDDEQFNVTSILPAGQQTLTFNNVHTEDCIGVSAAVLQVAQSTG